MLLKRLTLLGVLLVSGAAVSQGPVASAPVVGSAADVQGLVTVSDGRTIASVVNGNSLFDGSHIVTSSSGWVTLKTRDGCEVKLGPNQSIKLSGQRSCEALLFSVQSLPADFNVAAARSTLLAVMPALTGALLDPGTIAFVNPGGGGTGDGGGGVIPDVPISNL